MRKERAVRRQGEVEVADLRELLDEPFQVPPDERFAAGEADLLDAKRDEDPHETLDLLEGQDLGTRQELEILAEDLLGHAVDAAEVATVRDADPQVAQRTLEGVERLPHR